MWIWGGTSEGKHFDELWALGSAAAAAAAAAAATASAQPAEDAAAVPKKPPRAVVRSFVSSCMVSSLKCILSLQPRPLPVRPRHFRPRALFQLANLPRA